MKKVRFAVNVVVEVPEEEDPKNLVLRGIGDLRVARVIGGFPAGRVNTAVTYSYFQEVEE